MVICIFIFNLGKLCFITMPKEYWIKTCIYNFCEVCVLKQYINHYLSFIQLWFFLAICIDFLWFPSNFIKNFSFIEFNYMELKYILEINSFHKYSSFSEALHWSISCWVSILEFLEWWYVWREAKLFKMQSKIYIFSKNAYTWTIY